MTLTEHLELFVEEFAPVDDPHERLSLIVDRAKRHPPLPATERIDAHRVRGCISIVWLVGELRDGTCHFRSDADSPIVRGLLALLCEFFSGHAPAEIATSTADPLAALDVTRNLSPTRRNGLASALAAIHAFAQAHVKPI
jgi:cysteine desulfuration protein SufE